jgi:U3 small nucleolar RNA-associated protein 19
VAAFAKRFARLSLTTTPAGALVCVRFIYNLLKRHPSCKTLIHRESDSAMTGAKDPFIEAENDPAKCRALNSSVWEVQSLLQHYHPDVAKLPKILETPALGKAEMDVRRAWSGAPSFCAI